MIYPEQFQIIRPSLPVQQLQYRNQYFKNWGNLNSLRFKRGRPLFVLPPYTNLSILLLFFVVCSILQISLLDSFSWLCVLFNIISIFVYFWTCSSGHGQASSCLPILNQDSFRRYKGYCQPCRIFIGQQAQKMKQQKHFNHGIQQKNEQNELIQHCKICKICYKQIYHHSLILGICVTRRNYWKFFLFYALVFASLVLFSVRVIE